MEKTFISFWLLKLFWLTESPEELYPKPRGKVDQLKSVFYNNGSGSKFFGPNGVNFLLLGRVGQPSLVWVWKISPKIPNFSIFFLWVKKISSDCAKKYPGQRLVGLLFSAGQKYLWVGPVRVGSGPISDFFYQTQAMLPPWATGSQFKKWTDETKK